MKRKIFALALAGLVAFSFTSCGDDDDNPAPVNPNNNQDPNNNNNNNNNNQGNGNENQGNGNENQGSGKNHYIVVDVPEMEANPWDSQFWIVLPEGVAEGDDITISFKCKADVATVDEDGKEVNFGLQWHNNPSEYQGNLASGHTFTTEWQPVEKTETVGAIEEGKVYKSITWNLNNFKGANKYYFDDISVKVGGVEKVVNGNIEGTDFKSFFKKELNTDTDPVVVTEANVKEE